MPHVKCRLCLLLFAVTLAACSSVVSEKENVVVSSSNAASVTSSSSAAAASLAHRSSEQSWSVYHHTEPAFSFSYPKGWIVSDDTGDMDVYIHPDDGSFYKIMFTYCGVGCDQCPDEDRKDVPGLGTTGCYFKNHDSPIERWFAIDVPVGNGMFSLSADADANRMPGLLKILATIRRSVSVQP